MREGPVWMNDFTIDETAREDAVALGLAGDLDMSATFALEPVLDRILADGARELVLDLGGVGFVDSSGLGLLIATHERTSDADVAMAITGAAPEIQRVFQIAGLDGVLPVRD
jgi:anti-sigma B factor antagonist